VRRIVAAYLSKRSLLLYGSILALAAVSGMLLTAPLRRHRLPEALAGLPIPADAILTYYPGGSRGAPHVVMTGDDAQLLLDCGMAFDGRKMLVHDCELGEGATIDDVLNMLGKPDDDKTDDESLSPSVRKGVIEQ